MFLSKLLLLMIFLVGFLPCGAQTQQAPAGNTKPSVQNKARLARIQNQTNSFWEVGLGFTQWNERIKLAQGTSRFSEGTANYGGPILFLEKNWIRFRWQFGTAVGFAAGQASSGAYEGSVTFRDGIRRPWSSATLHSFAHYRVNPLFMVGAGLLMRYRAVDWEPSDQTVTVTARDPFVATGQINFRLRLLQKVTLFQSYAPLGFEGESLWTGGIQYIF